MKQRGVILGKQRQRAENGRKENIVNKREDRRDKERERHRCRGN